MDATYYGVVHGGGGSVVIKVICFLIICVIPLALIHFELYLPAGRQVFNNWINATE